MAGGVIYLDSDDEITSAAARIRTVEGGRVAVVLPYGSRLATSRINFRLLARDALTHEKRLAIVSGDPATRALAASAGLPIFASVSEYEGSIEAEVASRAAEDANEPPGGAAAGAAAAGLAAGAAGAPGAGTAQADPASTDTGSVTVERSAASATGPVATPVSVAPTAPTDAPRSRGKGVPTAVAASALPAASLHPDMPAGSGPRTAPVQRGGGRGIGRGAIVVGGAVLVLAALVGGVAAYLLLPSATAVVTAREETIGPLPMTITAATDVTEPDTERGIVPAEVISIPVEATDTFEATGQRVELQEATGSVRFSNLDPTSQNTIARGAIVSTSNGVRFRTDSTITVGAASLEGFTIVPASKSVKVTAVEAGPDGNVEANAITVIPRGEEPILLKVTNPDSTRGGKREEFPRVTQKDVDGAIATLTEALSTDFRAQLADPGLVSGAATVFAETADLPEPTFAADPADLVGQEVESFELGASATGTVTAVDESPVEDIAEERLTSSVDDGFELVDDSGSIDVQDAVVADGTITFPVVATAKQVRLLDPAALEAAILGKPEPEAQAILDGFGTADLRLWPDWVNTVPTIDSRVDVSVTGPVVIESPGTGPSPSPSEDAP